MKKGDIVQGRVTAIKPYGAFVQIDENTSGMIHISEISHRYVKDVENHLEVGKLYNFEVLSFEEDGKVNLTMKKRKPKRKRMNIHLKDGFLPLRKRLSQWIDTYKKKAYKSEDSNNKKENDTHD
ncbi:MAG: S1 RNA-binding domain-containing protein [Bacillota bacterium]